MATLTLVEPAEARRLIDEGAVLVDVREADQRARAWIPGSRHAPLSRLEQAWTAEPGRPVIFHCRSGNRTVAQCDRLAACAGGPAYVLDGGLEAWRKAGLPVRTDARQPLEVMRQVQITAGTLVLLGLLLGWLVAPGFLALSAFVGAGLVFAGVTGWCGMAKLLAAMPWNRRAPASAGAAA